MLRLITVNDATLSEIPVYLNILHWFVYNFYLFSSRMILKIVGNKGRVACVSAPTLYKHLKQHLANNDETSTDNVSLKVFEFDPRFAMYGGDFVLYDYRSPLDIPREMRESFDLVFADPPFLSEECLTKTAVTLKFLAKERIVLCTGAIMADLAHRLLRHQEQTQKIFVIYQCFGSGSGLDPDSIRSVDPYPDP
jgi:16S rRNA G966 N2-methylase RsmD